MRTFDVQGIEIVAPGHKVFEFVTPSRGHTLEGPRRVGSLLADLAISSERFDPVGSRIDAELGLVTGCAAREEVGDGHFQLDEFKTRQRALWAAGEYEALSPYITDVGELVVTRAAVEPGMQVLDVACGTGNAARPAARAGARVTGVDLVPKFLEVGRAKAEADGLAIDWREGDAENLPFEEGRFDRVLSTFGHMFAPRHQRTADEMTRVCRRGGAIVTATWLPTGTVGDVFRVAADYLPPPPDYASPPILWGREDHVRELFAGKATAFEFEHQVNRIQWDSLDGFADFFMARFPLMVMAQAMLGERFAEFRARIVDVWRKANQSKDGRLLVPQQYLLSLVRL